MPSQNARAATLRRWTSRCLAAAGVVLLAAVPTLGLTMLNPAVFSHERARKGDSSTDTAVAASWNLFAFDAPTTTLRRTNAAWLETDQHRAAKGDAQAEEVVPSDWKFTQFAPFIPQYPPSHLASGAPTPIAEKIALLEQELLYYEMLLLKILEQQVHIQSISPSN